MRLLLLAKRTAAHGIGGLETHVLLFGRVAAELGHEVIVVTTAHPEGRREEAREGVRIEYLDAPPGVYSRRWWDLSAGAVRRLLADGGADLVLSISLAGYGVARAGSPTPPHYAFFSGEALLHLASEWHDRAGLRDALLYPKRAASLLYYARLEHRYWKRLTGIIATYDGLYDSLRRRGWPVSLCYSGTDVRLFRPHPGRRATIRQARGIPAGATVLLMVATVNRQKGIWVGVEAFRRLAARWPDLHLLVVGDGPDRPRLERLLRGSPAGARAHWAGELPLEAVAAYNAAGDLLLYPTFRAEGLPTTIMEAMAVGLPVVASDRGGIRSGVRDGETGLLLPAPDPRALEAAVARLLADPPLREKLAQGARQLAMERFDIQALVPRLLATLGGGARS